MERGERACDRRLAHEESIQRRSGSDRGFDVRVHSFHDHTDNNQTAGHGPGNPIRIKRSLYLLSCFDVFDFFSQS